MTDFSTDPFHELKFKLVHFRDIAFVPAARCIVEDLIPKESLVLVWGPPKCGKSFFVFDLVMHVALGREYHGKRVEAGDVVYIAAEGELGIKARVEAFRKRRLNGGDDPRFKLLITRLDLVAELDQLVADIKAQLPEKRCSIVVLDTLNRTIHGSEGKDDDMGAYRDAADRLREEFDATVIIIHHCGIDGTRPRGHTSLTGAIDTQIAVKRDIDNSILIELELMKDGPEGEIMRLALEVVDVGIDPYGKLITSCVIKHLDAPAPQPKPEKPKKLAPAQAIALKALREAIARAGEALPPGDHGTTGERGVCWELWRDYAYATGISAGDTPDARRVAFKRAVEALIAAGRVGSWQAWFWLIS
jgi:hypothetical protein